jgi:BirA family biotin operon repressor/biotin-[acetyl-CoA-carboxylase] ligase
LRSIIVLDTVDSTQDEVIRRLKASMPVDAVLAYQQTEGRGRFGRRWESHRTESLSISFAWQEASDPVWPPGIALAAGLAAAETFDTALQWPNDLVIQTKKVGGILSEMVRGVSQNIPVIGLGINLTQSSAPGGLPWASSLLLEGRPRMAPMEAAVAFLEAVDAMPIPASFGEISERWRARDQTKGKTYRLPDGVKAAALYVDDDGNLVVKAGGERLTVPSAQAIYGNGS